MRPSASAPGCPCSRSRDASTGSYLYNPDVDFVIEAGATLVVLGTSADVETLRRTAR